MTWPLLRTERRSALLQLTEDLSTDDRMLLVLRLDRGLAWPDVARVFLQKEAPEERKVLRESARLRKRFQVLRERLRDRARLRPDGRGPRRRLSHFSPSQSGRDDDQPCASRKLPVASARRSSRRRMAENHVESRFAAIPAWIALRLWTPCPTAPRLARLGRPTDAALWPSDAPLRSRRATGPTGAARKPQATVGARRPTEPAAPATRAPRAESRSTAPPTPGRTRLS